MNAARKLSAVPGILVFLFFFLLALPALGVERITPEKSPNDQSDYRYLVLDNDLRVLLVSTPDSDKAAASLDISVGSGDDPAGREGLAHFLEHMLFLGTEKYPEPGEYQQFIRSHGGSHNAFTAFQDTNYFFDVQAEHLEPALDRFAQQFSAPLFTAELVDRERHAVHSEYSSLLKEDGRRLLSVKKAITNPAHAYSQFAVGNLNTLDNTEERPLREDLLAFWKDRYSANLMTLTVVGPQSLDTLEDMVRPRFSAVENRNLERKDHAPALFKPDTLPARLEVQSLKDVRRLTLAFPIPSQRPFYEDKPQHYVANLLGHEGPGSLFDVLKSAGLVESLSAGTGNDTGRETTLELSMALTPEGLEKQDEVIRQAFAYIELVRNQGVAERRFEEMQQLAEIDFRFKERQDPVQRATHLSMLMHDVEPADILRAPWMMESYQPEQYRALLERLRPENVLITVLSPQELEEADTTTWYDTPYRLQSVDPAALTREPAQALASQLSLPAANPFVPEDLGMVPGDSMEQPRRLSGADAPGAQLWFARDTRFETPKANIYLSLRSPETRASARNSVLTQLLVDTVNSNLNAWAYPAQLAGLDYRVYTHLRGVTLRVGGYNDKLHTLMNRILLQFANPEIREQRFRIARAQMIDSLENNAKERPVSQISGLLQSSLIEGSWTTQEKLDAARGVSLDELEAFAGDFLREIEAVMLAHGNLTEASALNLAGMVDALLLDDSNTADVPRSGVRALPEGVTQLPWQVDHPDTGYLMYLQGDNRSLEERAAFRLLGQVVSSPFYEELRTTRQLGYIVYATAYEMLETPALGLVVQSPGASAEDIDRAITEFTADFRPTLEAMQPDDLRREQQAVISKLLEKDRRLTEVSERYWQEIDRGNDDFDSREQLAGAVDEISSERLLATFEKTLEQRQRGLRIVTTESETEWKPVVNSLRQRPAVNGD